MKTLNLKTRKPNNIQILIQKIFVAMVITLVTFALINLDKL
jgi:hypothetical protein